MELRAFSDEELRKELSRREEELPLVDIIHAHFCPSNHNDSCEYYHERQRIECWELPTHQKWREETRKYMEHYGFDHGQFRRAFSSIAPLLEMFFKLDPPTRVLFTDIADLNS